MTEDTRSARTERLLISRLDALAKTAASLPHAETERLVELATVATMRAVALDLLRAERAEGIWREAHARHPVLRVERQTIHLPVRLAA
jgi:hypothetical protein